MFSLNRRNFLSSQEVVFFLISLFDMEVSSRSLPQSKYFIHYIFYLKGGLFLQNNTFI